jgi:spermidine synthase
MNARVWKIAPLLFGSGFCALVYQTAWQRELRLIFGASTAASAAVLAIFMGGLGLGGALLGARADRDKRPLGLYANLELLICAATAVTPLLVDLARALYVGLGGTVALGLGLGTVVRLVLSALVLAGPTLLMGGTLPAAARAAETAEDVRRRSLAVLYGLNTLGAVAGAVASTFFLFEVFGTRTTLWLACLLNVLVALVARSVARSLPGNEASVETAEAPAAGSAPVAVPPRAFVLGAAALVGFAFFLMELVWYRMLGPLLGGSTFTFGLILAVALVGIGLGGAAYAAWGQQRPATLHGFALTCLLEALFIAVPFALGDRVALLAMVLRSLSAVGFGGLVLGWTAIAALVVLPAAFISGVQFPLLLALLGRGGENVGRQVGLAYAWNTVGSIVGSLAGGFGLLPLLTAPGIWRLVAALLVALGLGTVLLSLREERRPVRLLLPLGSAALAVLLLFSVGPTAVWRHSGIGAGRAGQLQTSINALRRWTGDTHRTLLWEMDGVESSVALVGVDGFSFMVNGKADGQSIGDAGTQVMGGLVGALAHPNPRRALVIGLGTGSTAGWLAAIPEMERVDVVELEPAILEVARRCAPVNERVLDNPKVRILTGDAREVLLASKESYDIIFSEPSNPYRAGISSLFTREFYQAVRRRLAPGGIFLQWLQAYEVDARTVRSAYATLGAEFASVETWQTMPVDLLLLATEAPLRHDLERLRTRVTQEPYRRALSVAWKTDSAEGVLARFVGHPRLAAALAENQEALVNTDDLSFMEFAFARSVGRPMDFAVGHLFDAARKLKADRPEVERGTVDWDRVELERVLISLEGGSKPAPPPAGANQELRRRHAFVEAYIRNDQAAALRLWREGRWEPHGPAEQILLAHVLASVGDEAALALLERLRETAPFESEALLGRLRLRQGRLPEATEALERAFSRLREAPWGFRPVAHGVFDNVRMVAARDATLGRRLYSAMEQPFSNDALRDQRLFTRLELAMLVDARGLCAEAFAAIGPHPSWTRPFLEERARCYTATGHPLRAQAQADLEDFLSEESTSLWDLDTPELPPSGLPVSDTGVP